jgi:hypothetical protein
MPQPLSKFQRPFDVARHPTFEPEVKRAILASWASDAAAVEGRPDLRHPPGLAKPVAIDDVFAALHALDSSSGQPSAQPPGRARRGGLANRRVNVAQTAQQPAHRR